MRAKDNQMVKVTFRIAERLRTRLREAVAKTGETADKFIDTAIERELDARGRGSLPVPASWDDPMMAQRFLEFLPTPSVIKDSEFRIVWCNPAYEDILGGIARNRLLGRRITDLGVLDVSSAKRVMQAYRRIADVPDAEGDFWEPLTLWGNNGRTTLFRAHRFVFSGPGSKRPLIGDISFDFAQIVSGQPREYPTDQLPRLQYGAVADGVAALFPQFLAKCPAAIAIKKTNGKMVWVNEAFEQVAGQRLEQLVGRDARTIFSLGDHHAIVQNDFTVARTGRWMYAVEELPKRGPRTSLRFPIKTSAGQVGLTGVVSAEFRQQDISDTPFGMRKHKNTSKRHAKS